MNNHLGQVFMARVLLSIEDRDIVEGNHFNQGFDKEVSDAYTVLLSKGDKLDQIAKNVEQA